MKSMTSIVALALTAAALFVSGCGRDTPPSPVLFTVNGTAVTAEDVAQETELRYVLFQNQRPLREDAAARARKGLRVAVLKTKADEMLLLEAAAGIQIDEQAVEGARERYFQTFHGKISDKNSFEDFLKARGVYCQYQRTIERETKIRKFLANGHRNELQISADTVEKTIQEMHRGNQIAEATNRVIYATATNVWQRAMAGEDFAVLARRHSASLELEPDGDLGDRCDFNDFKGEDISIWNSVSTLKAGEVTPPLSTSEGLAIYKCYERTKDEGYAGGVRYHLARILFHRALLYENFSEKYVRSQLEREAYDKVVSAVLEPRRKSAVIIFPNGEKDLPKGFVQRTMRMIGKDKK